MISFCLIVLLLLFFVSVCVCCVVLSCPGTLCKPGWPQTHRDLPASASQVLGLKVCTTIARLPDKFYLKFSLSFLIVGDTKP